MQSIEKVEYNRKLLLLKDLVCIDCNQRLYIEKSFCKQTNSDNYFIKAYKLENDCLICQGYIYFYIDKKNNSSTYIGTKVKEEYRNKGVASLLTSSWIKFCLDNDIYNLNTNKKQRKPFLLYALKTYSFELDDVNKYAYSKFNIHICKKEDELTKYLFFENLRQKENFMSGKIYSSDNYQVLDETDQNTRKLDTILLSNIYYVQDNDFAYDKSAKVIDRYRSY